MTMIAVNSLTEGKTKVYTKDEVIKASTEWFNGDVLAAETFARKYAMKRSLNEYDELTPDDMHDRMATALAEVEPCDKDKWRAIFREQIDGFKKLVPQGSPMAGLGHKYNKIILGNCYVVPIHEDSLASMFQALHEMAQIQAYRGGVGIDISTLRPEGATVANAAVTSTGAWSWCDLFSYVTRMVGRNGRTGALMLTMDVSHPDIMKFISMKADLQQVTGANVSVKLSDDFMRAVVDDQSFELRFDFKSDSYEPIVRTVRAREVWDKIIKYATTSAEPGLLMWDNIIRRSPADSYAAHGFRTVCTNPCITGDSKILTESGYKTAKELWELGGRQEYSGLGKDPIKKYGKLNIVNRNGTVPATNVYRTSKNEKVYRVELENGQYVNATAHHRFILADGTKKDLYELKVGDEIPLNQQQVFGGYHNPEYAEAAGWIIGDGSISNEKGQQRAIASFWDEDVADVLPRIRNNFNAVYVSSNTSTWQSPTYVGSASTSTLEKFNNKKTTIKSSVVGRLLKEDGVIVGDKHRIPNSIWNSDRETVAAFLRGLFSADGSVQINKARECVSIRLSQSNIKLLQQCQVLLNQFGIVGTIRLVRKACKQLMNDGKNGQKLYDRKDNYELIISRRTDCDVFSKTIGFIQQSKSIKLSKWLDEHGGSGNSTTKYVKAIKSIVLGGEEEVFCLTEPSNNEITVNGMVILNCAELPLSAYDSCRLTSINLTGFVHNSFMSNAYFDMEEFKTSVAVGIRILDNMVTIDSKFQPFQQQIDAALKGRRLGLGIHGLADMLSRLGMKYDSDAAIAFVDKLMSTMKNAAYRASVNLARERGPFPIWDSELEADNEYLNELDEDVKSDMAIYGRRNIAMLTVAPTGTVSLMSKTSSGLEPVFSLKYKRRVKAHKNEDTTNLAKDALGDYWKTYDVYHPALEEYFSATGVPRDMKEIPDYWITADKIDWEKRLKMQAAITRHLDHSSSSTINLPKGTSTELVGKIYIAAWQLGLKGVTVYVDGSRDNILVHDSTPPASAIKDRPKELDAVVHTVGANGHTHTIFLGFIGGNLYEVFCLQQKVSGLVDGVKGKIVKAGPNVYNFVGGEVDEDGDYPILIKKINKNETDESSSITRLVSTSLRFGVPLEEITKQLMHAKGTITSMAKSINRVLAKYAKSQTLECPECGGNTLIFEEGCMKCGCGYAKCG